jgi:Protein of unknown function (DUF3987)
MQRFQLSVCPDEPDSKGEVIIVDEYPNRDAANSVYKIVKELAKTDFIELGAETSEFYAKPFFRFDEHAFAFFETWLKELIRKVRRKDETPVMCQHLNKFKSLMPSLALIFYLVDVAKDVVDGKEIDALGDCRITLRYAKLAALWCDYLESHARRIYQLGFSASAAAAERLLDKLTDDELKVPVPNEFSSRDIYTRNWALLDSSDLAEAAIDELLDAGWVRASQQSSKPQFSSIGRPLGKKFTKHPKLRELWQNYHGDLRLLLRDP